jgi:hypothetical protein
MIVRQKVRLQLHADAINGVVTAASAQGRILDVSSEAKRIARATGLSPVITALDLVEAGVVARIAMELPRITYGDLD